MALEPPLEALPDELEFEAVEEPEELVELLATDVVLPPEELDGLPEELLLEVLPLLDAATLADEVPDVPLALSVEPPPHALRLRQAAAAAAVSSGEKWGDGMNPAHSLFEIQFT